MQFYARDRRAPRVALNPWKIPGIVRRPVHEFIPRNVATPSPNDILWLHKVISWERDLDLARADLLMALPRSF